MSSFPTPIERISRELDLTTSQAWADLLAGLDLTRRMTAGLTLRFVGATPPLYVSVGPVPTVADGDWVTFERAAAALGLDGQAAFEQTLVGLALREAQAEGHVLVYHGDPDYADLAYWEGERTDGRISGTGPTLLGVIDMLNDTARLDDPFHIARG